MIDEIFDRSYQAGRAELNTRIGRALANFSRSLSESMRVMHRIQFDAPWKADAKGPGWS